jgi:ketosteroid isomerase-like protein
VTPDQIARAFSQHRFEEAFSHLRDDIVWTMPGTAVLAGKAAVVDACRRTSTELADTETEWHRTVCANGSDVIAVDAVARYVGPDGVTAVSSCDIFEFVDGAVAAITSYAAEVDPGDLDGHAPRATEP